MSRRITIFTDGGSRGNPGPAAIGVNVLDEVGETLYEYKQTLGVATNNEAEYEAFFQSATWLTQNHEALAITHVDWKLDSMLVVEQLNRRWKIKDARMLQRATQIWALLTALPISYTISHVARKLNHRADELVNQALDEQA